MTSAKTYIKKQFRLVVNADGAARDFASVFVYDGFDQIIGHSYGKYERQLDKGIYRIVIELNETSVEETIRLDKNKRVVIKLPSTSSSVVAKDFKTSRAYFSESARKWSRKPTVINNEPGADGSVFIYFRTVNEKTAKDIKDFSLGDSFYLLDSSLQIKFSLSGNDIKEDKNSGWLAFHTALKSGQYYLHYEGERPRTIPIYVFPKWQTQIFLTFNPTAIFGSLKILLAKTHLGFDPTDGRVYKIDAMLQKLYNGSYNLPDPVLTELAYGKWDNPMAALIGAHLYLNSDKKDKDNLFNLILKNLETKILKKSKSPDIIALKMLAALHFKKTYKGPALKEPCMILSGMTAAARTSARVPKAIVPKSPAELILVGLYKDIPWTSFDPISLKVSIYQPDATEYISLPVFGAQSSGGSGSLMQTAYALTDNKMLLGESDPTKSNESWVTSTISNYLQMNKTNSKRITVNQMAAQLELTPSIVKSTINDLRKTPAKKTFTLSFKIDSSNENLIVSPKKIATKSTLVTQEKKSVINSVRQKKTANKTTGSKKFRKGKR